MTVVRVALPQQLRDLARVAGEVTVEVAEPTQRGLIDALEGAYPPLRNTVRDPATGRRRPFVRFYACDSDLSHEAPDALLPAAVTGGGEVFRVIGAISGG